MTRPLDGVARSRLERLLEISRQLSSTLDLSALLSTVVHTVTDLTGAEAATILLVDDQTEQLYYAAVTGMDQPDGTVEVPQEGSIAGWVVRRGEPLTLEDVSSARLRYAELKDQSTFTPRNVLAVPLIAKGKVIGVLEAINKHHDRAFTEQDLSLVQALASQAAVGIVNVRLFQQTDHIAEFMHELKTPLMALTAATELLARETLPPRQEELLELIEAETTRLSKLAQDFLDLARLESGRIQIRREPVDLSTAAAEVVRVQQLQAADRGIKVSATLPDALPPIMGDVEQLKQVIHNLMGNAVKYSERGDYVHLALSADEDHIELTVSDSGPGIASQYLPHLFERFYRVPDQEGYSTGTGLGLPIARRIVEEHGGTIEVESQPEVGSTFRCRFPMAPSG